LILIEEIEHYINRSLSTGHNNFLLNIKEHADIMLSKKIKELNELINKGG